MTAQEKRIWDAVYAAEFQSHLLRVEIHVNYDYPFDEAHKHHGYSAAERARDRADEAVLRLRETAPYHKSRI